MGRHRRSAAGRAATGRADRAAPQHRPPGSPGGPEHYGPENLYGFAAVLEAERQATRSHRKKKALTPVRTGLLGVSAAVAIGTVAVASGVLPGGSTFRVGGDSDTQAGGATPSGYETPQGGTSGDADDRDSSSTSTSRDADRSPTPSASTSSSAPAKAKPKTPAKKKPTTPSTTAPKTTVPAQSTDPTTPTSPSEEPSTSTPVTVSAQAAAEAEVVRLVNVERAKVGCSPVAANSALTQLAENFSADMAQRGFFDHTDPDGKDPWDRAAVAGITDLGGENIALGQADAAAVMDAWMDSPGHKANILNCDFTTLGVGVVFGDGGPWWTQDFGY
ncbi:SCP-like extracellular [Actinobacteria bacterium OK074]|nr:SCP-like extracellular [Actinobacteria bacterium OK074]